MIGLKDRALRTLPHVVLAFVSVLVCGELAGARDVALVIANNSHVRTMKATDLARMIRTTHRWLDGKDLTIVLTDPYSQEMRLVAHKLLQLTSEDFEKLIETGNKTRVTFVVVSSANEVLKKLQGDAFAIGLVNVYSINSSVEVIRIDNKLPLEQGYILHTQ